MISAELGKPLEQFVAELVATGRYGSKSEVLREGVRLIQERELKLAALDAAVMRGLEDADQGHVYAAEDVFAELERRYGGGGNRVQE
jgi:antitoxin ParD1/3/4